MEVFPEPLTSQPTSVSTPLWLEEHNHASVLATLRALLTEQSGYNGSEETARVLKAGLYLEDDASCCNWLSSMTA